MIDTELLINPNGETLGSRNAVLWGRGRRQYHVAEFSGPLSIKAMIHGSAEWRIANKRFHVDRDTCLILNDRQPYSITVDAPKPVETFCVFFERGFVEDVYRSLTASDATLLDEPFLEHLPVVGFTEHLHDQAAALLPLMRRLHAVLLSSAPPADLIARLAETLVRRRAEVPSLIARLPARKPSTRDELFRRVLAGRHWLDENCLQTPRLHDCARAACLSPFHFQRLFRALFHESPQQYVARRRLQQAARLLTETNAPVTMVCLDTGFQSPGTFSTMFRSRYGLSPRQYRDEFARSKKFPVAV